MAFVPLFNAQIYIIFRKKPHVTGTHFFRFLIYYAFSQGNVPKRHPNHWWCDRYTEKWLLFHCSMPKFVLYLKKKNYLSQGHIFLIFSFIFQVIYATIQNNLTLSLIECQQNYPNIWRFYRDTINIILLNCLKSIWFYHEKKQYVTGTIFLLQLLSFWPHQ